MSTVRLQGVTKSFAETVILQGVDLTVNDKEFIVIVGPSGCGKTTLLRLIAGRPMVEWVWRAASKSRLIRRASMPR